MAVGTVLSRVTGFGRVAALAYALGFVRLTDAYNLANTTPNIVYELVAGGVLSATLVPVFVERLSTRDRDEAWRAVSAVATLAAAVLAVLSVAFALAAPWVIRLYTFRVGGAEGRTQHAVATDLLRMFAPQVLLYGLITVATAVLQARRRFLATAASPVLNNLVVIAVLLAFPHVARGRTLDAVVHDPAALALLGLGTTAGVAVQAGALWPALRRAGARLRPRWDPRHEAVRAVVRLSGWTFGYVAANQVALWVVLALANGRAGDVAAYQSAYLFFLLPHGVLAVSVMTALLPELAERWSVGDTAGFGDRLSLGLRVIVGLLIPVGALYAVLARPVIRLLLLHGNLSAASADTTATVLAVFAGGLPAFSAYLLCVRAYQAIQDTRAAFGLYAVENGANIALAFALYGRFGVAGLAGAYGIAYGIGTVVALWRLGRRLGGVGARRFGVTVAGSLAAAAVSAAGAWVVSTAIGGETTGRLAARVVAGATAGVSLFALSAGRLGLAELVSFVRIRRGRGDRRHP
jgi:putative peptidoglycan lipid II flippase